MKAINRFLIALIIVLIALILEKSNIDSPFNFTSLKKEASKHINLLEISNVYSNIFNLDENAIAVNKNYVKCINITNYKDYMNIYLIEDSIPVLKEGLVVYIGNNELSNKTVIIKDYYGNEFYYGNLYHVNLKLYQQANIDDIVGSCHDNKLIFKYIDKNGKKLDEKSFFYI